MRRSMLEVWIEDQINRLFNVYEIKTQVLKVKIITELGRMFNRDLPSQTAISGCSITATKTLIWGFQ